MSATEGWELTVPEDAAELLAELRRHGVQPGQRLRVARANDSVGESAVSAGASRRNFDFTASFTAEPDLAARTDEYLQRGFGRE